MTAELEEVIDERPSDASTRCKNCGSYVTSAFTRVFGDNKDHVYACLECSTMRALRTGSGVVHE
jgi:DNA-directed RNA polymerase subunit RPC12/RpoP